MSVKHYSCEEFTLKEAIDALKQMIPNAVVTEVDKNRLNVLSTGQKAEIWSLTYKELK